MRSRFSIPIPENLDEELALEDERQQRRRAHRAALATADGSAGSRASGSEGSAHLAGVVGSHSNLSSFAGLSLDRGDGAVSEGSNEERPVLVAYLPQQQVTSPKGAKENGNGTPSAAASPSPPESAFAALLKQQEASPGSSPLGRGGSSPMRLRLRDVRAFCNFLHGKRESFNIRIRDGSRGVDVIDATIRAFLAADDRLKGKMSEDPKDYRLYSADDHTGEDEFPLSYDAPCSNISSIALKPLPGAFLSRFPQHQQLLPPALDDIEFTVNIRGPQCKRTVHLTPDLCAAQLAEVLVEKLQLIDVEEDSVMIHYGPTEVHVDQPYGFGAGGERYDPPLVKDRTLLSLHRFGVKELSITANVLDDAPASPMAESVHQSLSRMESFRKVDEEEARTYRQFEVVKTNKYGARQERVLGVDADRIYNMKPGGALGKTKNPERSIADIQNVRTFPDRPTYFEIEYTRDDTDRIEARNAMECALLVEKLRVLIKMHQHSRELKGKTSFASFLSNKLGFGK